MSNNKQVMKLYSEEQVRQMLFDLGDVLFNNCQNGIGEGEPETYFDGIIESVTPIELPSDEEIYIEAQNKKDNIKKLPFDSVSFQFGAMWLRDKIQVGE